MKPPENLFQTPPPVPWQEGDNIPWHEPDFSKRMLDEHLSQAHDGASRRTEIIEKQVSWIHSEILEKKPSSVLDLGCGPGLYTSRLAALGHTCLGIDYAPASIDYAKSQAETKGLNCTYVHEDIRTAAFGQGHGLATLLFGEFNVFRKKEIEAVLEKIHAALNSGGALLLEAHTFEAVFERGQRPASLQSFEHALFSSKPHTLLQENFWDDTHKAATRRFFVTDRQIGEVRKYASSLQAYTESNYKDLLKDCGFHAIKFSPQMGNAGYERAKDFVIILAWK